MELFENKISLAKDFTYNPALVKGIEINTLQHKDDDFISVDPAIADTFSVYITYSYEQAVALGLDLNPSQWVADCDTMELAEQFAGLLKTLLNIK